MSEPLPCPECGAMEMARTVEDCQLKDGLSVRLLRFFKCRACGAKLFDDDAMHRIQSERATHALAHAV
jgi:predicted RNA-binding Zn-ribbon protein involved in translation (DUF1610 family)